MKKKAPVVVLKETLKVRNLRRRLEEQARLRLAVVIISAIGGGLSIALNVEHAPDNLWARLTGAWPPIAVVITVELVSRIPASNWFLAAGRILVTTGVGGGAFYVSFIQQYDYMLAIGWEGASAWIFPLITDGVVVVALLSMIEVVRTIRHLTGELDELEVAEIEAIEKREAASDAERLAALTAPMEPAAPVVDTPALVVDVAPVEVAVPADEAVDVKPEPVKPKPRRRRASSKGFGYPGADGPIPSFSDGMGVVVDAVVESAGVPVDAAV